MTAKEQGAEIPVHLQTIPGTNYWVEWWDPNIAPNGAYWYEPVLCFSIQTYKSWDGNFFSESQTIAIDVHGIIGEVEVAPETDKCLEHATRIFYSQLNLAEYKTPEPFGSHK